MTKMVRADEFQANSLALLDEAALSGERLTITRNGEPAITLTASKQDGGGAVASDVFGALSGSVIWLLDGDTDFAIDAAEWELDEPNLRRA